MRFLLVALLLVGCDSGRYQISASNQMNGAWRVDTKTGDVSYCTFHKDVAFTNGELVGNTYCIP